MPNYFSAITSAGRIGSSVGRAFISATAGKYGRATAGASWGAFYGAFEGATAWGPEEDSRKTILGQAIKYGAIGAGLGGAYAVGRGVVRGYPRNMARGMGWAAGVRDARRAKVAGIRASRFIGNTTRRAYNGFRSMWR